MKKFAIKFTAVFFVLTFMFASVVVLTASGIKAMPNASIASAVDDTVGHVLVVKSDDLSVVRGKKIHMTATVTNVEAQPPIKWTSSDTDIAVVDKNGTVTGISAGKAIIFATAEVDGKTLQGEFAINVVTSNNFLKDLLEDQQILSYQYSYIDDYYYTNDKEAWQYNFGFGKIYDFVSPYILLEYDYIRIFFEYEGKDWMMQMWKGQYGMVFYGSEIGIYNRPHSDEGINEWTMFNCPAEEDWLMMEMTLYHEELDGTWKREFSREYDKYWWCTGFKNGHLRQEEPADELRMEGRITLKDAEMTRLVADGLVACGFGTSNNKENIGLDKICVDGNDIYFTWQNINDAESTMAIKVSFGALSALAVMPFWPLIMPFVNIFAVLVLLVSVIL